MKKMILGIVAVLLVFTLSSCTTEEKEITIIVYSENPQEMVSNLEGLPELIANELQALGYEFNRVVLQSSSDVSVIQTSLANGLADMAILDPTRLGANTLIRVLDVSMDEVDHPEGDEDHTTYQKAIIVSPTVAGDAFQTLYEGTPTFMDLNSLNVCAINEDEFFADEFAKDLGATSGDSLTNFTTYNFKQDLYEDLEDGSCDLAVVTLEDVSMYTGLWDENEFTIYEGLSVLHVFEPLQYSGFYVSVEAEELLVMSLVQSFIQISAYSSNQDILDALGHDAYRIPNE